MEKHSKHILLLSSWYPTRVRPFLGNFIQRFALLLTKKYRVTVLYVTSDPSVNSIEIADEKQENLRELIVYFPEGKTPFHKLAYLYKAFKMGMEKVEKPDLIHANVLLPKGFLFLWAKKHFGCPLIVSEHGSFYREEVRNDRKFLDKLLFKQIAKKVDKMTAVSEVLKEDMQYYFPNVPIQVLPNYIDHKLFQSLKSDDYEDIVPKEERKIRFLHISTLDESIKDPKGIIDACKILVNNGVTNFHLTMISDEPYAKWDTYLYSKNLTEYVTFLGPYTEAELVPYYQQADAFILFSKYETFSIVLAEAWSCGLPVISTPVGIAKDMDPKLGIQVQIGKPDSLARAMHKIIFRKKRFNVGMMRKFSRSFSRENVLKAYDALVKEVL